MRSERNGLTTKSESPNGVFDQDCAHYLRHLKIQVQDGQRLNAPYRKDADSESFVVSGVFFMDHSKGSGGNVWELALLMHDWNRKAALKSLYDAADLPWIESTEELTALTDRDKAKAALAKVRVSVGIDQAPQQVRDYLDGRKVSADCYRFLGYIPRGGLTGILTEEEIRLTGLGQREELLILWYLRGGKPVYYCTRDIGTKDFRKASVDYLDHPIWNLDDLYSESTVVWAEGMFDSLSLKSLGFGVAGEITCHPIKSHLHQLVIALRWRAKHHPDWRFIILLDNDEPGLNGNRPGNDAAERLATDLWQAGLDVHWVRHENTDTKVDINALHVAGRASEIHRLVADAKLVSTILPPDAAMTRRNFVRSLAYGDLVGAHRLVRLMTEQADNAGLAKVVKETLANRIPYKELYRGI